MVCLPYLFLSSFGIICYFMPYFYFIQTLKMGVCMKKREENFAMHIIENNCTIRQCAQYFNISKSTVHNDVSVKLKKTNKFLYLRVYKVLNKNLKERHIRGGLATKLKYSKRLKK